MIITSVTVVAVSYIGELNYYDGNVGFTVKGRLQNERAILINLVEGILNFTKTTCDSNWSFVLMTNL